MRSSPSGDYCDPRGRSRYRRETPARTRLHAPRRDVGRLVARTAGYNVASAAAERMLLDAGHDAEDRVGIDADSLAAAEAFYQGTVAMLFPARRS